MRCSSGHSLTLSVAFTLPMMVTAMEIVPSYYVPSSQAAMLSAFTVLCMALWYGAGTSAALSTAVTVVSTVPSLANTVLVGVELVLEEVVAALRVVVKGTSVWVSLLIALVALKTAWWLW